MSFSKRVSRYYKGCDGTKLAVDLMFPPEYKEDNKYPVVMHVGLDQRRNLYQLTSGFFDLLLENGYVVAIVEPRGVGASYGIHEGFYNNIDARDIAKVIDTIGMESWCSGNIGMMGGSNLGNIQQITASEVPKHLKAIAPCDCNANLYYQNFTNGASALPDTKFYMVSSECGEPVDEDVDGTMAEEAKNQHKRNHYFLNHYFKNMWRDSINPQYGYAPNMVIPAWTRMDNVKYSGIKVYQNAAWYDPGAAGEIITYKEWGGKLFIGPYRHMEMFHQKNELPNDVFDWEKEHIRFFDQALKGIETGTFNEPDIYYYTKNAKPGEEWRYTADWPLDNQVTADLYFSADSSGTLKSCYDGSLKTERDIRETKIDYVVNEDIHLFGFGKCDKRIDGNFVNEEPKCVTFTSAPLPSDMEITGIPVLDIWVTSEYKDGNFLAVLDAVDQDGNTDFITDGAARASHATLSQNNAWDALGLPYHSSLQADAQAMIPGQPFSLTFNMEAVSYIVKKGSRIRLNLFCGAKENYHQPEGFPEKLPTVTFFVGGNHASHLRLPVIKADVQKFKGRIKLGSYFGFAEAYAFKKAVFFHYDNKWKRYPCRQVYFKDGVQQFVTESFTAQKFQNALAIQGDEIEFDGAGENPDLYVYPNSTQEIRKYIPGSRKETSTTNVDVTFRNVYVATVPIKKGRKGMPNPQPYSTKDLFINIALPKEKKESYPCMVNIHGYGGDANSFLELSADLLKQGYAVASIDYRIYPPNIWPAPIHDVNGCIRFLKANAKKYRLDPERFGVFGGSAGGHLSAMVAASNGDPCLEGDIGGNTELSSDVKAAAVYFPWTDIFTFGEDNLQLYPGEPDRMESADGPFAPLGCIIGYDGEGRGMGELKKHVYESDPYYQGLIQLAKDASPISHVSVNSAPCVFIHGISECGIQIPMSQSVRMFEALTRKGVKSILLCNNNGCYGDDPEVRQAVLKFIEARV